jgi:hypothetical protein
MSQSDKPVEDSRLNQILQARSQLTTQLQIVDDELQKLLLQKKRGAIKPLTQSNLKTMIGEHIGDLKVTELAMFSNLSLSTYYHILRECENVKISSIKALLHTIGLDLFIGQKIAQSPATTDAQNESLHDH